MKISWGKKLPLVFQTEAAECGLACLAMIAGYHGAQIDLAALRQRFSVSLRGATLAHVIRFAGQLDLTGRPVRVELADLAYLKTPAIFLPQSGPKCRVPLGSTKILHGPHHLRRQSVEDL